MVVLAVVAVDLAWEAVVVVMPLKCSMQTAVTSLLIALNILFVLVLQVDVLAVDVATVEQDVDFMGVPLLYWVEVLEHSVCKVEPMLILCVPIPAIPV